MNTGKRTGSGGTGRDDYEAAINALIDGELDEGRAAELRAAAEADPALARAIVDAWNLQRGLDELRLERAPARLARRLRRIPAAERRAVRANPWPWRLAAGGFASVVLVAFAMMMSGTPGPAAPEMSEQAKVEAARRDLAIAFHYLARVGDRTGARIGDVLQDGVADPVTENLTRHMPYTETVREEDPS